MSAIDELKSGITIDASANNDESSTDNVEITLGNTEEENPSNVVNLTSVANTGRGHHRVILPKSQESQSTARKVVDISTLPVDKEEDPNIKDSIEGEILNIDDPNSMLSKYISKQRSEMTDWVAEKEEERRVNEILNREDNIVNELTGGHSSVKENEAIDIDMSLPEEDNRIVYSQIPVNVITEDISSIFNDNKKEEEVTMSDIEEKVIDNIPELPEEAKAVEKTEPIVEEKKEVAEEAAKVEEKPVNTEVIDISRATVVEGNKEGKVEEVIEAPDIDITMESSNFEATEIVEEDEAEAAKANEDREETLKHLQKLATEKLKPISKKLNISSFTVLKKPVVDITKAFKESNARVCKWVLPNQESTVFMKEFSGSELEKLREYSQANRSVDAMKRRFQMIYDHIVSPKPANFETWLKTTPYEDVDHYFFSIYISSFKGSNYLPEDCPNKDCKETFLTDDIDIMKMVKFATNEAKEKFASLYQSEATPAGNGIYCTEIIPLSEKFAISFREPSINSLIEIAGLDERALEKFSSIIEFVPYIDSIYLIDQVNQTLTPITYKMYPDNASKTTISKIAKFDTVFSALSVDEFGPVKAYIRAISEKKPGISYVYPSVNCPKCGSVTNEIPATAEELVFTRYQLGALTTTSLN